MDLYYKQEVTVGMLVMVALGLLVGGLVWLSGVNPFAAAGRVVVPVRFANVSGLQEGDLVQMSGFRVGFVSNVVLEDVGRVMVYLDVPTDRAPHVDAKARVMSTDFLGEKVVDYIPGNSPQMLTEGQVITGSEEQSLIEGASGLTDQAAGVLTGLQGILTDRTADDVHETLVAARRALEVVADLGEGPAADEATAAIGNIRSVTERLDSTLANPAIERSVNQLDELTESLREMAEGLAGATSAMSSILGRMDSGEGAFGKALTDSTLHTDLHELLVSMRELLDDMRERPGRYFRLKVF
jgi:phospholipid/cholesterol/gamma-HCH transport system substrate-binding protein